MEISHNGKYLFTVNTGSGNISSYAINPDGSLALIGSTPIAGGGADIDARLSPDGTTLSVDGSGNHILSVFAVNGGTLTELPSSPTPLPAGGAQPGSPISRHFSQLSLACPARRAGTFHPAGQLAGRMPASSDRLEIT